MIDGACPIFFTHSGSCTVSAGYIELAFILWCSPAPATALTSRSAGRDDAVAKGRGVEQATPEPVGFAGWGRAARGALMSDESSVAVRARGDASPARLASALVAV